MICWVVERTLAARSVSRVIVATDDHRILEALRSRGYEALETRSDHKSGTDRVAEVASSLDNAEVIVNVQGDEPMISPETIDRAVAALIDLPQGRKELAVAGIATTWEPVESVADILNPDVVKIALNESGQALYFSRSPIPFPREAVREYGTIELALESEPSLIESFRKHTGLYVYWRDLLLDFTRWPQSELERRESLEQLRALEHGVVIRAVKASSLSIGVDTYPDFERVRDLMEAEV
jgi:3-deoxy-manno-octulosonate cytidylyltransferase (CMP-KDO synthetase)